MRAGSNWLQYTIGMKRKGQNYHYLQKILLGIDWISPLFMFLPQPMGRPEFLPKFLPSGRSNVTGNTLTSLFIFALEINILQLGSGYIYYGTYTKWDNLLETVLPHSVAMAGNGLFVTKSRQQVRKTVSWRLRMS